MAKSKTPFCEFNAAGKVIRIFRKRWQALRDPAYDLGMVREHPRADATDQIRRAVFDRDDFACVKCGKLLTLFTAEMHEKQFRGQIWQRPDGDYQGGEVSIENGETRCKECHTGKRGVHRAPQFS